MFEDPCADGECLPEIVVHGNKPERWQDPSMIVVTGSITFEQTIPRIPPVYTDIGKIISATWTGVRSATIAGFTAWLSTLSSCEDWKYGPHERAQMRAEREAERKKAEDKAKAGLDAKPHPSAPIPDSPSDSPGEDWEWKGSGPPESGKGNWVNNKTGQKLHPDLHHKPPKGPHWGLTNPDGTKWDYLPGKGWQPVN